MNKPLWIHTALIVFSVFSVRAEDLEGLYGLAQQNDPTLAAALAARDSALESRPQALSQLLPNVFVTGDADRVHRDVHSSPLGRSNRRNFGRTQAGLSLIQPLYNRERWIQLKQTDNTIASANADYLTAQQDLIFRTADAYFNVLQAADDLIFSNANKEAIERQLDQAKQRFDVGLIAITDVHEAQAAFDRARAEVIVADNDVDNAWEALHVIILPDQVNALARLKEKIPLDMPVPKNLEEWTKAAQRQNFNIVSAMNDAQFARKNIEVQRSGHYPTLDIVGSITKDNSTGSEGVHADTAALGVQLNLPLYTGGGVSSRVRQAHSDFEQTQKILSQQRRAVNQQVRDSFRGVESAIGEVQALKATTVSAESALDATEAGYEVGTRTIIDVLEVTRRKFEIDRDYYASRYVYILNGLRLKQAASILSLKDVEAINAWLNEKDLSVSPSPASAY